MKALFLIFALHCCFSASANNFKIQLYQAFIEEDIPDWENVLKQMKKSYVSNPNDSLLYTMVRSQLGLLYLYSLHEEEEKASKLIEHTENNLELLLEKHPDDPLGWAKGTSLFGFKISLKPYKVMFYGPKSIEYMNQARALNKHLPEVMIEYGNMKFSAPSFAGGDKELGLRLYQDAIAKMVAHEEAYKNDWFFLMAHLNYAYMLRKMGQKEEALQLYEWLLNYEPDYEKLSHKLIPEMKKELNKS